MAPAFTLSARFVNGPRASRGGRSEHDVDDAVGDDDELAGLGAAQRALHGRVVMARACEGGEGHGAKRCGSGQRESDEFHGVGSEF